MEFQQRRWQSANIAQAGAHCACAPGCKPRWKCGWSGNSPKRQRVLVEIGAGPLRLRYDKHPPPGCTGVAEKGAAAGGGESRGVAAPRRLAGAQPAASGAHPRDVSPTIADPRQLQVHQGMPRVGSHGVAGLARNPHPDCPGEGGGKLGLAHGRNHRLYGGRVAGPPGGLGTAKGPIPRQDGHHPRAALPRGTAGDMAFLERYIEHAFLQLRITALLGIPATRRL